LEIYLKEASVFFSFEQTATRDKLLEALVSQPGSLFSKIKKKFFCSLPIFLLHLRAQQFRER